MYLEAITSPGQPCRSPHEQHTIHSPQNQHTEGLERRSIEEVSRPNGFAVAIDMIEEEEGFNTRAAYCKGDYFRQPEVVEHINQLAAAYAPGEYVPPLIVKVKGGRVFLRRRRAIHKAIHELGAQIKKASVLEVRGDDAEQSALIARPADLRDGKRCAVRALCGLLGLDCPQQKQTKAQRKIGPIHKQKRRSASPSVTPRMGHA